MDLTGNNASQLSNNLADIYKRAFKDLLEQAVGDPTKEDWLVKLYDEIREKLVQLSCNSKAKQADINEKLDTVLFKQMLKHDAFEYPDLCKLVQYTFATIAELCAPARDERNKERLSELLGLLETPTENFAKTVSLFVMYSNESIDEIIADIRGLAERMVSTSGKEN